jgi:hypothetical protein
VHLVGCTIRIIYASCIISIYESEDYKLNQCDLSPNVDWSETGKVCLKYNQIYISLLHITTTVIRVVLLSQNIIPANRRHIPDYHIVLTMPVIDREFDYFDVACDI